MTPDSERSGSALVRAGLRLAAPLWLVSWSIMRLGGKDGPGAGWTAAHAVWIVAAVLFGAAAVGLFRRATSDDGLGDRLGDWHRDGRRGAPTAGLALSLAGAAALAAQFAVDLVVGLTASDGDAMDRAYDDVWAVPGVRLALFEVGPPLLFTGLLALAVVAAVARRVTVPTAALIAAGVIATAVGRGAGWHVVDGLGFVALAVALAPLAGPLRPGRRAAPVPAA